MYISNMGTLHCWETEFFRAREAGQMGMQNGHWTSIQVTGQPLRLWKASTVSGTTEGSDQDTVGVERPDRVIS